MFLTHWLRSRSKKHRHGVANPVVASRRPRLNLERMEDRLVPAGIPALHSNPGATAAIYLDFDGHFEPTWLSYTNITTPAYDSDGDPTAFGDLDEANIRAIWARAAEDFAPFNIDVTTVEPAVLAPGVPSANANKKALRVAIGGNSADWYGNGYGGVGAYNSFTNATANVCFVFTNGNGNRATWVGDTASHEAGHSFGLRHQSSYDANGVETSEYSIGASGWSPIMGSPVYSFTTWSNGPTTSATTLQDDLAMLASTLNGFGYRADDHGNTSASATPLTVTGPGTWARTGIVSTNADVDYFSFTVAAADTFRVTAAGPGADTNLDAVIEVRTAGGQLLQTADPGTSFTATLVRSLAPGSYTVAVRSNGVYGRIGSYTLGIDAPPAGITVASAAAPTTGEDGRTTTFTVVLDTAPVGNVVIPISSSNPGEGAVSVSSLTFTPANWNVPQTVTIIGVNDAASDGDIGYTVMIGAPVTTDPGYSSFDPADLTVVNLDDEVAGFIYYTGSVAGTINRARLDGSFPEVLIDLRAAFGGATGYAPGRVVVDSVAGKLYWTDSGSKAIHRANLDGSAPETVVNLATLSSTGLATPNGLALDLAAGKMYWSDSTAAAKWIRRANLDGSGVELLYTTTNSPSGMALDTAAGKMYWTEFATGQMVTVRRANLDGAGLEILWTSDAPSGSSGVVLDAAAGMMYWADSTQRVIRRANLDGSAVEVVVNIAALTPTANISALALDVAAGTMYWRDLAGPVIYRSNLDGTRIAGLMTGAITSGMEVVRFAPGGISVTGHTGVVTTEGGSGGSFRVVLTSKPTANVVIPISSTNTSEGTVSVSGLTFTPANWNVPQTVTVTPKEDASAVSPVTYAVVLGTATSADPTYTGLNPADATVTSIDNDFNKFFVVDDASTDRTYRYGTPVNSLTNSTLNGGNSAPRGAASTIAGDKLWVVDANKKVYVYNSATGALLGSWSAGSLDKNATVEGITVFGNDVWLVDSKQDRVYRYANAATRTSGSQIAASDFLLHADNIGPKDLVTDGTSVWVVDDQNLDRVYKYTLGGTCLGRWNIDATNASPTGITLDPADPKHLWVVDSGTDRVYQYNDAVYRTTGSQNASTSYALASGNTNPQGIADPPPVAARRLTPGDGDRTADSGIAPRPASSTPGGHVQAPVNETIATVAGFAVGGFNADEYFSGMTIDCAETGTNPRTPVSGADDRKRAPSGKARPVEASRAVEGAIGWGVAVDTAATRALTDSSSMPIDRIMDPSSRDSGAPEEWLIAVGRRARR